MSNYGDDTVIFGRDPQVGGMDDHSDKSIIWLVNGYIVPPIDRGGTISGRYAPRWELYQEYLVHGSVLHGYLFNNEDVDGVSINIGISV